MSEQGNLNQPPELFIDFADTHLVVSEFNKMADRYPDDLLGVLHDPAMAEGTLAGYSAQKAAEVLPKRKVGIVSTIAALLEVSNQGRSIDYDNGTWGATEQDEGYKKARKARDQLSTNRAAPQEERARIAVVLSGLSVYVGRRSLLNGKYGENPEHAA